MRQNAHLDRSRNLVPTHGPSGTIPNANPVTINVSESFGGRENAARDILIENIGATNLQISFDGGDNWKLLIPGACFSSYCVFRTFMLKGAAAEYEILYNVEGQITFSSFEANLTGATINFQETRKVQILEANDTVRNYTWVTVGGVRKIAAIEYTSASVDAQTGKTNVLTRTYTYAGTSPYDLESEDDVVTIT